MYLKFSEFLRAGRLCGSVVDAFIFLFNRNTLHNRSSVLKMAAIVYELKGDLLHRSCPRRLKSLTDQ